jgi:hypothetical protein
MTTQSWAQITITAQTATCAAEASCQAPQPLPNQTVTISQAGTILETVTTGTDGTVIVPLVNGEYDFTAQCGAGDTCPTASLTVDTANLSVTVNVDTP